MFGVCKCETIRELKYKKTNASNSLTKNLKCGHSNLFAMLCKVDKHLVVYS